MRNLRTQLLVSHMALVLLMLALMIGGLVNVSRLGRSIDRILKDNYNSVIAAQEMKETLERQDSAATFLLAGQAVKARRQYEDNKPRFLAAYDVEAHNITEPGEQQLADDIERGYEQYHRELEVLLYASPPKPAGEARAYYFGVLEPAFLALKQRAQDVLDLNQRAIVRADKRALGEARRASIIGATVTLMACLFALVLVPWTVRAALTPLRTLTRQAEEIGIGHLNQRIELKRTDEIGMLATSFNRMAERLRVAHRLAEERLHRAERMSDAALESLYDPVLVTDAQGAVVHLNPAAEGLFGPVDRARGRPVSQVVQDERIADAMARAIHQEHITAAEDEAGYVTRKTGETARTYRLRAGPMRDEEGGLLGAVAVLEDITHLRELDRLKTEFISVASHELRTPVTSLLLSVQLMKEGAAGPLTEGQREVVEAQNEDLARLEQLTKDLLDMTRLEAGVMPPRFELLPPSELALAAIQSVESTAETKGVRLVRGWKPGLPDIRADRGQMTRVLVNLLSNAIRHTPSRGSVTLTLSPAEGGVSFEVRDTGVGIPPDYLPRIFERFVQVPGATRGGAGLGLSIAQTIVRAHGGEMTVESAPGNGAAFRFTLPTSVSV